MGGGCPVSANGHDVAITVHFGQGLKRSRGAFGSVVEMRVPSGTRIRDVIDMLELPQGDVGIISRDGAMVKKDAEVRDGDVLWLYPPIGGGD